MSELVLTALLWFCALGCGLMAGLYFAFSTFIMTAFGGIEQARGVAAMNAINAVIVRSLFMPIFMGTTLVSLALAIRALFELQAPLSPLLIAAGVIYVLGMFVVTIIFNVPLNNQLTAMDPASPETAPVWSLYLKSWTAWNHVRTVSSTAASALYIAAI